jgi:quinohemoprotein ethanol dehydrogenase
MKNPAGSQLASSHGFRADGGGLRRPRRALFFPLLAASLACLPILSVAFSPTADENWREPAGSQWSIVGGDWHNSRYSSLKQIRTETVARLGGAWTSQKFDAGASRATPVVKDGVMFVTAGASVYALNARTGETLWQYGRPPAGGGRRGGVAAASPGGSAPPQGSPSKEGVALGDGLVFAGLADAQVIALKEKTGELAWSQYIGDTPAVRGQAAVGAPTYASGLVFVGLNADRGFRGQAVALDAKTGRQVWKFFVVPGPGEPGHETWPGDGDSWKTGGGAIWLMGAADPDLGLIYFVTGNGVPQHGGEVRAGDNLYLCSVIALEMKTGKLRWHYQAIRHDIWEADLSIPPVLYDTQVGGQSKKGVAVMRGDGYLFLLDRENGKPLMPVEDRPVPQDVSVRTALMQPFPVGADRVLPDCGEWRQRGVPAGFELGCFFAPTSFKTPNLLAPFFGMRVAPMAYSPQTGYFYAVGNAWLRWRRRAQDPYFFSPDRRVPGVTDFAVLAAIDSRTNKIVWRKELRRLPGGAMPTAGGLMFQAAGDGNLQAYDARSGGIVWQFLTGLPGGGPVMSYEVDGEQYVAYASTSVSAFKLDGALKPAPAAAPRPPAEDLFVGPITDTNLIETASLARDMGLTGARQMTDEYTFGPVRARVKVGTPVTWINNGTMVHTVIARDGSWTTGALSPIQAGVVKFDKPGTYIYTCKDHPWAAAQLIVVE